MLTEVSGCVRMPICEILKHKTMLHVCSLAQTTGCVCVLQEQALRVWMQLAFAGEMLHTQGSMSACGVTKRRACAKG